jgi:hypothetical protein
MSQTGGMFGGDPNFNPAYQSDQTTNPFVAIPDGDTPEFYEPFPFPNVGQIKFSTGDGFISAITDFTTLKYLIDARQSDTQSNIDFTLIDNAGTISEVHGNVLSRTYSINTDPFITYSPTYNIGVTDETMLWGEGGTDRDTHVALKNNHGGMNVYINQCLDPLYLGSFSGYASLADEGNGGYSLTTIYTPVTTTASRKIQIYANPIDMTELVSASESCPSVNQNALKIGDDIDQTRIDPFLGEVHSLKLPVLTFLVLLILDFLLQEPSPSPLRSKLASAPLVLALSTSELVEQ